MITNYYVCRYFLQQLNRPYEDKPYNYLAFVVRFGWSTLIGSIFLQKLDPSQNKTSTMIFHNYTHWCFMRFKVAIAINLNTSNWSVYIYELSIAIRPGRHWTRCFCIICVFIKIKIKVKTTGLQLVHDQRCLHISSSVTSDKTAHGAHIYWVHSIVHYIIIFIY